MEVKANTCGELSMVRLFVGGIPPGTTCEQLEHRFASFGVVAGCHIVGPKEYKCLAEGGSFYRGLGYVDLEPVDDAALRKCMAAYNGSKWRGHVLRCQVAKPDYVQRLQQEREEDLALQEQEQERRRTLPPLEPGATLRLRHPSKLAATLPVQLGTGEKLTSFPSTPPRNTRGAGSWEPLAQPRGARYVFEQRLREVAEQLAAQFPRDFDDEAEDDERTAVAWRGRGGTAIPMRYSPESSEEWDGAGPSQLALEHLQQHGKHIRKNQLAAVKQAGAVPAVLGSQPGPAVERKTKVVDFTLGEAEGQGAGQVGMGAGVDLSRFASDSEGEEPVGKPAGSLLRAAAVMHPAAGAGAGQGPQGRRGQGPQRELHVQQGQQQGLQLLQRGQQQQHSQQRHQQSAPKGSSRSEPAQRAGRITLAELPRQQAAKKPRPAVASNTAIVQQASRAGGRGTAHKPAAAGSKRGVVEFLAEQEQQQAFSGRPAVDLSRFGSDSEDSGGGWQVGGRAEGGIPQVDGAGDSSSEGREPSSGSGRSSGSGSGSGDGSSSDSEASSGGSDSDASGGSRSEDDGPSAAALASNKPVHVVAAAGKGQGPQPQQQLAATGAAGPPGGGEQQEDSGVGHRQGGTAGSAAQQAPAWLSALLPSGAGWCRQERFEQLEAAFRVNKEAWAQDYRGKHRQAVRHLSRPVAKKPRRK